MKTTEQTVGLLTQCFLHGNYSGAWSILQSIVEGGLPEEQVYHFLTESMQQVGQLWENNEITVADEHLATATCDMLLTTFRLNSSVVDRWTAASAQTGASRPPGRAGGKAMFLCQENEEHYLGLKMAAFLFQSHGWEVRYLGSKLPLEYAEIHSRAWRPDLIGLSVSISHHLPQLQEYVETLASAAHRPCMMVGGRMAAHGDVHRHVTERTLVMRNLDELVSWLTVS